MSEAQSNWYYFCSTGCGFCKKVEPIVDELNKENDNLELQILRLDLAEGDNGKLANELKEKYKVQCGTPWFINAETGKGFCGYREKDIIKKWLDGKDIPAPPRPKGQMPRPPFHGASKKEEKKWKSEYKKWTEENSHLPNLKTTDELLSQPRPKSMPPQPWPNPSFTDVQINEWKVKYEKWLKENSHLPNTISTEQILQRMKNAPSPPGAPPSMQMQADPQIEKRIRSISTKLDKLMAHLGVK
jgi:thiol-disulfide isomerase/thioredoxin